MRKTLMPVGVTCRQSLIRGPWTPWTELPMYLQLIGEGLIDESSEAVEPKASEPKGGDAAAKRSQCARKPELRITSNADDDDYEIQVPKLTENIVAKMLEDLASNEIYPTATRSNEAAPARGWGLAQ
jgi:hypothetical protein